MENLAIVVTGSETGKFGQAGHTEYASGKAGLQYGLVRGVKNEIVRLNAKARINAVAPGWVLCFPFPCFRTSWWLVVEREFERRCLGSLLFCSSFSALLE
jgi:NAD(P)-dependent dehydrogenase (short-subunit alcohol dehydrogenase family)